MSIFNEIVTLLIGIGTLIFLFINREKILKIPNSNLLMISFLVIFTGWIFTILETFFWEAIFNFCEHICYTGSIIAFVIWLTRNIKDYKNSEAREDT